MFLVKKTSAAIDNLWKEGIFEDLRLEIAKVEGEYIWLSIVVTEKAKFKRSLLHQLI